MYYLLWSWNAESVSEIKRIPDALISKAALALAPPTFPCEVAMPGEILNFFKRDIEKYYRLETGLLTPSPRQKFDLWMTNHGFHCVAAYRFGQFAKRLCARYPLPGILLIIVHRLVSFFTTTFYHVNINRANISAGLYICHVGTIYIGPSDIGENLSITHNVTIGTGHSIGKEGVPRLGDNVWIGTGSTIFGDISIGNNVTVASGTVLSRDVHDRCLVGGNPGRVMLQDYDNSTLFGCCEKA
jgi:serine O-acetyltransferase